jgi:hypothetical protein
MYTSFWATVADYVSTNQAGGVFTNRVYSHIYTTTNTQPYLNYYPEYPTNAVLVTNLWVETRDRWALECFLAAYERARFWASLDDEGDPTLSLYPNFYYRDNRKTMGDLMGWCRGVAKDYVDMGNVVSNRLELTNGAAVPQYSGTDGTGLCARAGVPPNFVATNTYLPWRYLNGIGSAPDRVATNRWRIVTTNSGVVTQKVYSIWEDATTLPLTNHAYIAGTNGQAFSVAVTNRLIAEGWGALDYNWDTMRKVLNKLDWRLRGLTATALWATNSPAFGGTSTNSWTEAKQAAIDGGSYPVGTPERAYSRGEYTNIGYWRANYDAGQFSYELAPFASGNLHDTNMLFAIDIYGYGVRPSFPGDVNTYDSNSTPFVVENAHTLLESQTNVFQDTVTTVTVSTVIGLQALPAWCDDPVATNTSRGLYWYTEAVLKPHYQFGE